MKVKKECSRYYEHLSTFTGVSNPDPVVITDCNDTSVDYVNGGSNPECYTPEINREDITIGSKYINY